MANCSIIAKVIHLIGKTGKLVRHDTVIQWISPSSSTEICYHCCFSLSMYLPSLLLMSVSKCVVAARWHLMMSVSHTAISIGPFIPSLHFHEVSEAFKKNINCYLFGCQPWKGIGIWNGIQQVIDSICINTYSLIPLTCHWLSHLFYCQLLVRISLWKLLSH